MALTKYKITDKEAAAKEHVFVKGNTKFITEESLTDAEAETLHNNGCPFIEPVAAKATKEASAPKAA